MQNWKFASESSNFTKVSKIKGAKNGIAESLPAADTALHKKVSEKQIQK